MFKWLRKNSNPKEELNSILDGYELPSFSPVVMKVLSLLRDPDTSMTDIAEQLSYDPSLLVSIFKLVNSAAFGLRKQVDNIKQAATLLGRARLESIVLAQAVKESLPVVNEGWFDMHEFWKLSAKRATLARHLAETLHPQNSSQAFVSGMLQDMAIPVLASAKAKSYEKIVKKYAENGTDITELEQESLNFDHQIVGELMAEDWELPDYLKMAISDHHHKEGDLPPAIQLVSILSLERFEDSVETLVSTVVDNYGLAEDRIREIIEVSFTEASSIQLG